MNGDQSVSGTQEVNSGDAGQLSTESMDKAQEGFMGLMDKFVTAKPEEVKPEDREALVKTFNDLKAERTKFTETKTKADKAAADAAKNVKPPDYKTLALPKDTKLGASHLEQVRALAEASKWPLETAKAVLERDSEIVTNHLKGVEEEFKKYSTEALAKYKAETGDKFEEKVGQNAKVVSFYEKQIPGFKAEIERMGLSNSYTANKFFNMLFQHLHMDTDKFEFGTGAGSKSPAERTPQESLSKLFPVSVGGQK